MKATTQVDDADDGYLTEAFTMASGNWKEAFRAAQRELIRCVELLFPWVARLVTGGELAPAPSCVLILKVAWQSFREFA